MGRIDDRLNELGITLPPTRKPMANYVAATRTGNLVYTAGQVSGAQGREYKGKLGADVSIEVGREAARTCALNALAALLSACPGKDPGDTTADATTVAATTSTTSSTSSTSTTSTRCCSSTGTSSPT